MSQEEIVIIAYYLLLAPYKKLPIDLGMNSNVDFWEFMRKYSTWPQDGLSYLNKDTGKFDSLGYKI